MNFNHRTISYVKKDNNANLIKLSSEYDNNCSEKEYVEVDDTTLDFMIENDRYIRKQERNKRDFESIYPLDDDRCKGNNVVALSVEEKYFQRLDNPEYQRKKHLSELNSIFEKLSDKERRRLYMKAKFDMTYAEIAEIEGITPAAVQASCKRAYMSLRRYKHILQKRTAKSWIELLKPPNFEISTKK